jgi:hypothetical protein
MQIQLLSLRKLLPAVPALVPLPVHLTHMFPKLRLLLKGDLTSEAYLTCQFTFMRTRYMFSLLVSVGESLQAPLRLEVRALQLGPLLLPRVDGGLVAGQVLSPLVVRATFLTPEGSL